jgi:ATP-dependent DNA ligase
MLRRPKLDGFRALLTVSSGEKVSTRSRRQRPLARYFLEIEAGPRLLETR